MKNTPSKKGVFANYAMPVHVCFGGCCVFFVKTRGIKFTPLILVSSTYTIIVPLQLAHPQWQHNLQRKILPASKECIANFAMPLYVWVAVMFF